MTAPAGWVGDEAQAAYVLQLLGADRLPDGKFRISGGVSAFMGVGPDIAVDATACYYVDGQPRSLAGALHGTSYGARCVVI